MATPTRTRAARRRTPDVDRRPLLIGEAPGPGWEPGDSDRPLTGGPARLLCELAGWETPDPDGFLEARFHLINLLDFFPGRSTGKGSVFPLAEAQVAADDVRAALREGGLRPRLAILLGKRVSASFRLHNVRYCAKRLPQNGLPVHVVIPHPSGINRALNDPDLRFQVGEVLREAL